MAPVSNSTVRKWRPLLELLDDRVVPATITVTGTGNTIAVDGVVTLREAITSINNGSNVNADVVAVGAYGNNDTIAFSIPTAGVATINVTSVLPTLTRAVVIDGTTQATNNGDTNPGTLGTGGTVGVGPDGRAGTGDELALATVNRPEVELRGTNAIASGLTISTGNVTIRGLAIYGFGTANIDIAQNSNSVLIEQNVLGTTATSFTDPGAGVRSGGENIRAAAGGLNNGIIQNNLVGFAAGRGIVFSGQAGNFQITGNEVRGNGVTNTAGDGIDLTGDTTQFTVRGNLVVNNRAYGIDLSRPSGGGSNVTVDQNTVNGNGTGGAQTAGIALGGPDNRITSNIIAANAGAGVLVKNSSQQNTISRNSTFNNGTIGIDLLTPTDNQNTGTAPYVTINKIGGTGTGGNQLFNFPILTEARINAGFLQLSGFTVNPSGVSVELFISDGDPSGFGEGRTYLVTRVEGSADDLDNTQGSYGPGAINGLSQGQDNNVQRFRFLIPLASLPGVGAGTALTATGTQANRTSEFSGRVIVTGAPTVTLSGTVFEDVNYGGGTGRSRSASGGVGRPNATVELYDATGAFLAATTTNAAGVYTFSDLPAGTSYSVRVVNSTVSSSRPGGSTAGLFAVQTYRTDVAIGRTDPLSQVGGAVPSAQDSGPKGPGGNLADAAVEQSVTTILIPAGVTSVSGLDFGFNFDTIVNTNDAGQGSLRQFITNSNALLNTGLNQADTLTQIPAGVEASIFMIPLPGVQTISPTSDLPDVTDDATWIDGFIQGGSFGAPVVELNGSATTEALVLNNVSNCLIRGLVVNRASANTPGNVGIGIHIVGNSSNNRVQGNFIGTDVTGTAALPNSFHGVQVQGGTGNIIGTNGDGVNDANEGNVISGNTFDGVYLLNANNNQVSGNKIGTNFAGTAAVPNGSRGVLLDGSSNNLVGTNGNGVSDSLERNIISGNGSSGVRITGTLLSPTSTSANNRVAGNYIGTDVTGTTSLANGIGILLNGAGFVRGNIIGTNANGVGDAAEANLISGNISDGIRIAGVNTSGNLVSGNFIGTRLDGTTDLGNGGNGVFILNAARDNTVGGVGARRNFIAFNSTGVTVGASPTDNAVRNVISRNSIFRNDALGIDLGNDGVTLPDPGDVDTGPNNLINLPILTRVQIIGANLVIEGRSVPGATLEFFIADPDPSGFGEGRTYLTTQIEGVARDADDVGNRFRFVVPLASLAAPVGVGTILTATATRAVDGTSEFSGIRAITIPPTTPVADLAVTKVPSTRVVAVGQLVTYTIVARNLGPNLAVGVIVADRLPAGVQFVSSQASQGGYNPVTGVWNVIALGAGQSATLRVTVRVVATGPIRNVAQIAFPGIDPNLSNNSAIAGIDGVNISKRLLLGSRLI